jgi:hypothetical protein
MGDGAVVTLATFTGPVTYVLHDGSEDPGLAAGRVKAGPAVRGAERGRLLAAFNGGFKLSQGVGGYMQEGHVAAALRRGLTSLVIDQSGRARIGIWGHGVPAPGEAVYSVRQNLPPLVLNGRPTRGAANWSLWGATLGGGENVARSALGQDAAGHLVYAASMSASPADLAAVMAYEGVRIAMELDINPEWVQLDVAGRAGGPLRAAIRGQSRPANQFLLGWARDFIAVLAPAGAGGRTQVRSGNTGAERARARRPAPASWLDLGVRAVGGLDVLEEATVHPEVLVPGRHPVPQPGARAEPGRPGQLGHHAAGRLHAGLPGVEHHDAVRRDGEDPVAVQAKEDKDAGQGREPLARRLRADHGLERLAGAQVLGGGFTHGVAQGHEYHLKSGR